MKRSGTWHLLLTEREVGIAAFIAMNYLIISHTSIILQVAGWGVREWRTVEGRVPRPILPA